MITAIELKKMHNPEYLQFSKDVLQIVNHQGPAALQVAAPYDAFAAITHTMDSLYKVGQASEITEEMLLLDERRDKAIIGFTKIVDGLTYHFDAAKQAAAIIVSKALKVYGSGISKQNYQAETETITSIVRDFTTNLNLVAALSFIGLTDWVTEMGTANNLFNASFIARAEDQGANLTVSVGSKRTESAALYYKLRDKINAQYTISDGGEPFKTTINQINMVIDRYHSLMAYRAVKHFDISGIVTDGATGKPLIGVEVSNGFATATTDSDGKYGFDKLAKDGYTLTYTFSGYKTVITYAKYIGTELVVNQILLKA